jgi:hypothetical protein
LPPSVASGLDIVGVMKRLVVAISLLSFAAPGCAERPGTKKEDDKDAKKKDEKKADEKADAKE